MKGEKPSIGTDARTTAHLLGRRDLCNYNFSRAPSIRPPLDPISTSLPTPKCKRTHS